MLSAVVFLTGNQAVDGQGDPAFALTRSLGSLVPAAIAGIIRDVTIAGPPGQDLATIADHAGCGFVEAAQEAEWLCQALALAKGPSVLLLRAGYVPGAGFIEELRDFDLRAGRPGLIRAAPEAWQERFFPWLAPVAAIVGPLDLWRGGAPKDFQRLTRAAKTRNLRTTMHRVG